MAADETTDWRKIETLSRTTLASEAASEDRVPGLTVLAHPDVRRIGDRVALPALASWQEARVSRLEPIFAAPDDDRQMPLADPHLSREPLRLVPISEGRLLLRLDTTKISLQVDGEPARDGMELSKHRIRDGVTLTLARRIVLLLHPLDPSPPAVPRFGMVGDSAGILEVRRHILRIADLEVVALIRGETGTGKELVARAIHQASRRRSRPFEVLNMGAIPPTLAAAELFGAARGAYTGADRSRAGAFARAHGGTLFLDEIGEAPPEVQVLLLRALETGRIHPVGSEKGRDVDVRVLAATDSPLEEEIEAGRFRAPLLHRLAGYEIRLPPLRQRRDDVGRLLGHFLRQELKITPSDGRRGDEHNVFNRAWLPASAVARLAGYRWPGNVRQLANVARRIVISSRGEPALRWTSEVEALLVESPGPEPAPASDDRPMAESSWQEARADWRPSLKTLVVTERMQEPTASEDRQALSVLADHDRQARSLLREHGGREIDKSKGFLLLFDRPVDALTYALAYHRRLISMSEEAELKIEARVGIHVGEVFLRPNAEQEVARGAKPLEVEGLARQVAASLLSLASAGQTLLTRAAFELARQAVENEHPLIASDVCWLKHGAYPLPDSQEPMDVFEVGRADIAPLEAPAGSIEKPPVDASMTPPEAESEAGEPAPAAGRAYRRPSEVGEEELLEVLRAHGFRLQPAAAALGISRTSLYKLIDRSPRIRKARDLQPEEIDASWQRSNGDLDAMAAELQVSRKGLHRRITQLGRWSSER